MGLKYSIMCKIWVSESSAFYSKYEKDLIIKEYADAKVEELSPLDVVERIEKESPDAVILDNRLPGIEGSDLINIIKEKSPTTRVVVISSDRRGLDKIDSGIMILHKPLIVSQFLAIVSQIYYGG